MEGSKTMSERNKAFALVAMLAVDQPLERLIDFLPNDQVSQVKAFCSQFSESSRKKKNKKLVLCLKELQDKENRLVLTELDPSWFVEFLKGETPQLIRLVMKNLPFEIQKKMIRTMPESMAKAVRAFQPKRKADQESVEILRYLFEKKFPHLPRLKGDEILNIQNLHLLSQEKLVVLFRELGLHELALALKPVNKAAIRAILHRLSIKDARELQTKLKQVDELSPADKTKAQLNILGMDIEGIEPDKLFLEIGLFLFSRAMTSEFKDLVQAIQYKLPTSLGYLLKRYVEQSLSSYDPSKCKLYQKALMERFYAMALEIAP